MFARTFRTIRKSIAPRWLTEGEGELVGYSLDILKDAFLERLRLGSLARLPQNGPQGETAPTDALTAMGTDRRVWRGIGETDKSYAARLVTWLTDRKTAGSPFALMKQLHNYCDPARVHGVSFRTVDARGNWHSRSAAGVETSSLKTSNWNWDSASATRWSRFFVIVYPGSLWNTTTHDWADADLDWRDSGLAWGSTISPEQAGALHAIVVDWQPAGTRCVNIILAFDPASFNPASPEPDGLYGRWSKTVNGVRVASRLSTARYSGRV